MRRGRRAARLNLALQGGGAHGAFTWGVLDRLLEEEDIELGWVSGTSAGAVNAVALAAGLADGGRAGAKARLAAVWGAVQRAGIPDFLRSNPLLAGMAQFAGLLSPYDFNPLGFDPLRRLLEAEVDFALIRARAPVELLIAATNVATGRCRLFRNGDIGIDTVLASACLPTLHHAVEIDGEAYWDGGFSANPDIVTLARESPVADTLIVQITPIARNGTPRDVRAIAAQANRITFNQPLLRDIELITTVRETYRGGIRDWLPWRRTGWAGLVHHRFHLVEAGRYTRALGEDTKLQPDKGLLTYLHGAGRTEMHKWLARHAAAIGRRETIDLAEAFRPRSEGENAQSGGPGTAPSDEAEPGAAAPLSGSRSPAP
ncbi:MAG: patatin-like phospholipase family protein [Hyphomicrobiaceae bacterium]